jgi:hypothetical protein
MESWGKSGSGLVENGTNISPQLEKSKSGNPCGREKAESGSGAEKVENGSKSGTAIFIPPYPLV